MRSSATIKKLDVKLPPPPIPVLRRCTHLYCVNCGISKQYYKENLCSWCGYSEFRTIHTLKTKGLLDACKPAF